MPRAGYELELLPILPLNGVGLVRLLKGLLALPWALVKAVALVAPPPARGGARRGRLRGRARRARGRAPAGCRTVILEPNAKPGLHEPRAAALRAPRRLLVRGGARASSASKGVVTGNPVRGGFATLPRKAHAPPLTLLVVRRQPGLAHHEPRAGGGAARTCPGPTRLRIVHQTGEAMRDEVAARLRARPGARRRCSPFLDDMEARFAAGRPRGLPQRRHHLRRADRGGQGRRARPVRPGRRRPPARATRGPWRRRARRA